MQGPAMTQSLVGVFLFRGDELLLDAFDELVSVAATAAFGVGAEHIHTVAELWGAAWLENDATCPPGHQFKRMRNLYSDWPEERAALAATALQVVQWARTHRFCGACGEQTQVVSGERCMRCPTCGHVAYPRISPVMMVLIRKGEQLLLARPAVSQTGRFSALAGFLEAGETIEQAVHREVMEEVGLKVHNLQYFASQSWPFPHSLLIAFTADYLGGEIAIDPREIAEARWIGPDDHWPDIPDDFSIAGRLIRANAAGREENGAVGARRSTPFALSATVEPTNSLGASSGRAR